MKRNKQYSYCTELELTVMITKRYKMTAKITKLSGPAAFYKIMQYKNIQ